MRLPPKSFLRALAILGLCGLGADAVAQTDGGPRETLRARWQDMSEQERTELRENWSRWKELSSDERAELRDRHDRMGRWQRRLVDGLEEEERERLAPLHGERRDREMARLTRERLREFMESVPDGVRDSMRERIRRLPPPERERFFADRVRDEGRKRLGSLLDRWVEEGRMAADEAAQVRRQFAAGDPRERLRVVRRLAELHPDGLSLSEDLLADLGQTEDPVEAMRRAHRSHFPPLRPEETARLLNEAGVPAEQLRRWLRSPEEQRRQLLARWTMEYRIVTPGAMARHLQQRGVPPRRVRAAYRGTGAEALEALRSLYREFGIEPLSFEESRRRPNRPPPGGPRSGPPGGGPPDGPPPPDRRRGGR